MEFLKRELQKQRNETEELKKKATAVQLSDYITYDSIVTKNNATTAYKLGNQIICIIDVVGTFDLTNEPIKIGTVKPDVVTKIYGTGSGMKYSDSSSHIANFTVSWNKELRAISNTELNTLTGSIVLTLL